MIDYKKYLKSFGYREMTENVWGKPFGHHLLTYELKENRWSNWFKSENGITHLWNDDIFEIDESLEDSQFIDFLKHTEAYTNVQGHYSTAKYEFLTVQEQFEEIL